MERAVTTTDWQAVSTIAACAGLVITSAWNIVSLRANQRSNSARMVLELSAKFGSDEMRRHRSRIAKELLDRPQDVDLCKDIPALEFLEEVAFMVRQRVLDDLMAWNSFNLIVQNYFHALEDRKLIGTARSKSKLPSLYRELEWLFNEFNAISRKERDIRTYIRPMESEIRGFLEDEKLLWDGASKLGSARRPVRTDSQSA